jgi:hypothetical protein
MRLAVGRNRRWPEHFSSVRESHLIGAYSRVAHTSVSRRRHFIWVGRLQTVRLVYSGYRRFCPNVRVRTATIASFNSRRIARIGGGLRRRGAESDRERPIRARRLET